MFGPPSQSRLNVLIIAVDPRMATLPQLPIHLPILPSKKRHPKKTCLEHQCPIRAGNPLASVQAQIHSTGGQGYSGVRPIPTPVLDPLGSNTNASIPWWRSCLVLCFEATRQQHPGALSYSVSSGHRCFHPMVEGQASTTCLGPARTVVPHPKSESSLFRGFCNIR